MSKTRKLSSIKTLTNYDFIDLGAGDGGSLVNCERIIGGRGLGVELNLKKVGKAVELRRNVVHGNALDIKKIPGKVDFVTCDNFLEHLPSFKDVDAMLQQAASIANDFIYIRHPSFEDVDYLKERGLKTFWADWTGHTSMLRVIDLVEMLHNYGIRTIKVSPVSLIRDSDDLRILPLSAQPDQHHYKPEHGQKPSPAIIFDRELFYAFDIIGLMPGAEKELPILQYQDRLNSTRHPAFSTYEASLSAVRKLEKDITNLKNRKSIRAADWLSHRVKYVRAIAKKLIKH